jgi:high affinity Mn2+ porin
MTRNYCCITILFLFAFFIGHAQLSDSTDQKWNIHFQSTTIAQYHFPFSAKYSGTNSLQTKETAKVSFTSTLYFGVRLWKNGAIYFNPEVAGGSGLSGTTGIAGFVNGETFRIGSPGLKLYLARLYVEQYFPLGKSTETVEDDANQLRGKLPSKYISINAGKFCLSDFFDNNSLSQDPRTRFMNWSLMSAGAWDYPANTRGYTTGLVVGFHQPSFSVKAGITQVPEYANGPVLDNNIGKAFGTVLEAEKRFTISKTENITIRIAGFYNRAQMGNYNLAVKNALANFVVPDITSTRKYSRGKAGFYLNAEHNYSIGGSFFVASWNNGKNETWAFTEIDRSIAAGFCFYGKSWKRDKDVLGIAAVFNGISKDHQNYLQHGGYGFIIGDGNLNYATENIVECYYSYHLNIQSVQLFLSPDYQFVLHPAYNKDRGPAHIVALRLHVEL